MISSRASLTPREPSARRLDLSKFESVWSSVELCGLQILRSTSAWVARSFRGPFDQAQARTRGPLHPVDLVA